MELFSSNDSYKLYKGDMRNMLNVIQKESIDAVLTDPPYELNFMNKGWDNAGVSFNKDTWKNCYEVLKPGGYLLAFGGSRTYHRIAVAIEDAGFEIRDTIMWLYGSGFPKSLNISKTLEKREGIIEETTGTLFNNSGGKRDLTKRSDYGYVYEPQIELAKQWQGWGTALKPSFEPIIVARKPFKGSLVDNVIENGVGGLNIDECRVEIDMQNDAGLRKSKAINTTTSFFGNERGKELGMCERHNSNGRFPANTILTYDETDFDEVCGGFPNTKSQKTKNDNRQNKGNSMFIDGIHNENNSYDDSGSASRYFMNCKYTGKDEEFRRYIYTPKASKKDRDEGLDTFEIKGAKELLNREENSDGASWNGKYSSGNAFAGCGAPKKNTHPTVKPTELMQYLVRLVTPNGGAVLDPFNGSGSTGKAVMYENKERNKGYKYIGIELTEEYLPIAAARIEYVSNLKEEEKPQTTIFDYIGDSNE